MRERERITKLKMQQSTMEDKTVMTAMTTMMMTMTRQQARERTMMTNEGDEDNDNNATINN